MTSVFIHRSQCPQCSLSGKDNSRDNLAVYTDHVYCFSCGYHNNTVEKMEQPEPILSFNQLKGTIVDLGRRGLTEKICRMYDYQVVMHKDKPIHIANYYRDKTLVAQHLRGDNKQFSWRGQPKNIELFGQHLWKADGGKRIIITEGEIDCLTVCQVLNYTWPVVSVPNGATSALRAIKDNLEFLNKYQEIILCFDMDEPGQAAVKEIVAVLPPGKCKIVTLPLKDANECLLQGETKALVTALWEAQVYSPDEILHVSKIIDTLQDTMVNGIYPFPYTNLNNYLIGQRGGEITLWASGTGSGKSTIIRELIIDHLLHDRSVGCIMLEEAPNETVDDLISLMINKPIRTLKAKEMIRVLQLGTGETVNKEPYITDMITQEYAEAKNILNKTNLYIYDHLGNNAMANLLSRIEYMVTSLGVKIIILDHITAAVVGLVGLGDKDTEGGNSERLLIDTLMKNLRSLVVRTGVHIDIVSQLKKTEKAYEEGDRVTLQDLRGSGALASVPNTVIGLERDRQNTDPTTANTTVVRVLKNRLTGRSGVATTLFYDYKTGRLTELDFTFDSSGNILTETI